MRNLEPHNLSSRTTSAFLFALFVTGISLFCWPQVAMWWKGASAESAGGQAETQLVATRVGAGRNPSKQAPGATTRAIETLRVGDRVLAHNPEVSQAERDGFVEPQWNEWLQLSLEMPKGDGSLLKIELLRPEAWVREQLGLVVEPVAVAVPPASAESRSFAAAYVDAVPYSPLLPILREVAATGAELQLSGEELRAIFVEMDLPELAITGPAIVEAIRGPPPIRSGAGRVVTATFHHSSGDVIDLVVGGDSNSTESIGTTSNHPFWSVDRQEYVQAGQLAIGERLQTSSGDTKRVHSKLARPGPQAVYNLEVFAEHVYYVGKDGVLVHNSGEVYAGLRGGLNGKPMRQDEFASFKELGMYDDVDPALLRWSQTSAGGGGRTAVIEQSMSQVGWRGTRIDVVKTTDGLTTVDHTRAAIAVRLGIPSIPVRVHLPTDPLPVSMLARPWNRAGQTASTWGDALALRGAGQKPPIGPTGSPKPPKLRP